jgi:hypothetical protein
MEDDTVRQLTEVLFETSDTKKTGLIDQAAFLSIHDRLLEMSQ